MQTAHPKKANVYLKKHRSENLTWCVNIGKKIGGKPDVRNFTTEAEAKNFANEWNLEYTTRNNPGLCDLSDIQRHDILAAVNKLKAYGATLSEAVDFFIRFARPPKPNVNITEAMEIFLKAKTEQNCRPAYIQSFRKTFLKPFSKSFPGKLVTDLTTSEAEKYVFSKTTWNPTTKASHIGYLRTFYEFLIKQGYAKLNPFKNLAKPRPQGNTTKILLPHDVKEMLQFALNEGRKAECATMAIVFFCGVRVNEAGRLNWDQVDLEQGRIKIEPENAKKRRRRVNLISPNALEWLKVCQSAGKIAPNDYAQRMKRFRTRAGVAYSQNAMRHCFATYHMSKHGDSAKTAAMLSHSSASMLYETYYDVVSNEQAEEFWNIVPNSVVARRQQEEKKADDLERVEAESYSNCGQAVRGERGEWISVQDESQFGENPEVAANC